MPPTPPVAGTPPPPPRSALARLGSPVNACTHTVYVASQQQFLGTVSVIDTATCNATNTTGCHQRFPVVPTGRGPALVAVDARTGTVYVTNTSSATMTILNGARCNATVTSGCRKAIREQAVGSLPFGLAINPRTCTVYVTNLFQAGSLSLLKTTKH